MSPDITIRPPASVEEYRSCQDAQRLAWGITQDGYVIPVATMIGAQHHGGLVLGAFLPDGRAVGLSFAFLGRVGGQICLYSQLTGVVPDYQGHGLGGEMKQVQWDYARDQGIGLLAWSFDPLQSGNAHFNLNRLGATSGTFHANMYGLRSDALNANVPTDRLIAEWSTRPRTPRVLSKDEAASTPRIVAGDGLDALNSRPPTVLVEIPESINDLRKASPEQAERWRSGVEAAFRKAFASGYRAVGFHREDDPRRCFYILE